MASSPLRLLVLPPLLTAMPSMSSTDIIVLSSFALYKKWDAIQGFLASNINPAIAIGTFKTTACLFTLLQLVRYVRSLQQQSTPADEFPVKPLFFPCQTSHVRMFPKKHGFSYSYLWVGIPIGWGGSVGGMISENTESELAPWWKRWFFLAKEEAWYTVNGDHYLDRGHVQGGLQGKLKKYLESQRIDHSQYAYAYLLTAARFLGYASNPVSVWHLYSSTKELRALVLEVNNTFDERRMYFLEPSHSGQIIEQDEVPKPTRYTGTWPKDFYVSTFNSRSGAYSIAVYDPLFPFMSRTGPVNTTITLSTADHAMLIARIYSSAPALDPAGMTTWDKTKFLVSWWWVGFATFPRTIRQALTLLIKKKMPWVFRPEPHQSTMPRHADDTELCIESQFRLWLRSVVESSNQSITVRYIPAGLIPPLSAEEIMTSPSAKESPTDAPALEIRVITPLFYTRIVQYPDLQISFSAEHGESATIALSAPGLVPKLDLPTSPSASTSNLGLWDKIKLDLIKKLRKTPTPIAKTPGEEPIPVENFPHISSSLTPLDEFVLNNAIPSARKEYLARISKLLLAKHLAFGSMELLDLGVFLAKVGVFWGVVKILL